MEQIILFHGIIVQEKKMNKLTLILISVLSFILSACNGGKTGDTTERKEDLQAKKLLQGIWVDSDDDNVVFKIKGDTIYYPDSLSQPIKFATCSNSRTLMAIS